MMRIREHGSFLALFIPPFLYWQPFYLYHPLSNHFTHIFWYLLYLQKEKIRVTIDEETQKRNTATTFRNTLFQKSGSIGKSSDMKEKKEKANAAIQDAIRVCGLKKDEVKKFKATMAQGIDDNHYLANIDNKIKYVRVETEVRRKRGKFQANNIS